MIDRVIDYITDPEKVARHSFLPFLRYERKSSKYVGYEFSDIDGRPVKFKIRPLMYAGHLDGLIYKYYSDLLNICYNEWMEDNELNFFSVAYRTNKQHQSSINFAAEAISFIEKQDNALIIIGDFEKFFDTLDHKLLKDRLQRVLKVQQELDKKGERISSIVIMGIGEPFENYDEMMDFIRIVNSDESFNIGARHITVSTSGIVPKIYDFANEKVQINFAVSLHAPTNELRSKIMPVNRAYNIDKLMEALKYYQETTNRRITFEYGLMGKVNDQKEHAEKLSEIIKGLNCHVNLIPINYVPERNYVRTSKNDIFAFEKILKKNKVNVTIRRTQGDDIDAACGQLRAKERKDEVKGGIPDATSIFV